MTAAEKKERRANRLRRMTLRHIRDAIEHDITDGEALMKEVYEHASGKAELAIVYREMRSIISDIDIKIAALPPETEENEDDD